MFCPRTPLSACAPPRVHLPPPATAAPAVPKAVSAAPAATASQAAPPAGQPEWPTRLTRRANEENTGEPFTFTETLFEYRDYVPDLQPHQVDARTRGLAQLCLVLFNANEFLYVY